MHPIKPLNSIALSSGVFLSHIPSPTAYIEHVQFHVKQKPHTNFCPTTVRNCLHHYLFVDIIHYHQEEGGVLSFRRATCGESTFYSSRVAVI